MGIKLEDLPLGYSYAATYAGIRKVNAPDLALIVSAVPASAAAMFTTNQVKAAPVKLAVKNLRSSRGVVGAIVVNAGNANCATRTGDSVARRTCLDVAKLLRLKPVQVLPASTGVIGVELPVDQIVSALPGLASNLNPDSFEAVATAIMTTDTVPKYAAASVRLPSGVVRIAGMTKGAGMIQPNMATTLGFVLTDAKVPGPVLRRSFKAAVDASYHKISVDGDTSTNDTVVLLANGASGLGISPRSESAFADALTGVMQDLARQIIRDAEGAKKLITIEVEGARTDRDAAYLARAIANSSLVKTAIAGADPNWGRIIGAAGYSGVQFDPAAVTISLQGVIVCQSGRAADFDEDSLGDSLRSRDCLIRFHIAGKGRGFARFWTCDLTEDYIRINGSYRT